MCRVAKRERFYSEERVVTYIILKQQLQSYEIVEGVGLRLLWRLSLGTKVVAAPILI